MSIESMVRQEWSKGIVQKQIFCPLKGTVLDMDTCWFVVDSDGDPRIAVSPEAVEEGLVHPDLELVKRADF